MSEKIYQALTEDFIRRMRNWALYDAGYGQGAPPSISGSLIYDLGVNVDRYRADAMIVLLGEAEDTKAAIGALRERYRDTVKQFWRYEKRSLRWHARKRQIEHRTYEVWVMMGHEMLRKEFSRRTLAWHIRNTAMAAAQRNA